MLWILAGAAMVSYVNGFAFHGGGHFIHDHDTGHYYLGSKYFPELGYEGLYSAMFLAEHEDTDQNSVAMGRELSTGERTSAAELVQSGEAIRRRFSSQRWSAFRQDVAMFRHALGPRYDDFVNDHGFNPTPFWALVGGGLAHLADTRSPRAMLALCLLDPLLVFLALLVVGRTFGQRVALLSAILFWSIFGAGFGWVGGAFLRHFWFAAVVIGCCLLHRRQHGWAGILFALATILRLFPGIFILGIVAKVVLVWASGRSAERRHVRFLTVFTTSLGGFFAATAWLSGGLGTWLLFFDNLQIYVGIEGSNMVGLQRLLNGSLIQLLPDLRDMIVASVSGIHGVSCVVVILAITWTARSRDDLTMAVLSGLSLFVLLDMAAYYYTFLILVVLIYRHQTRALMALFILEGASHWLPSMLDSMDAVYMFRSLLVLYLLVSLHRVEKLFGRPSKPIESADGTHRSPILRRHHPSAGALEAG